jgi:ribonuclease HI
MPADSPHYLLFTDTIEPRGGEPQWQFDLQPLGHGERVFASDVESDVSGNRLELLAAVRGIEALAEPARVTLMTRSRYVRRGISQGLSHWRARNWQWERFGRLVAIRDQDLWQRLDRALTIHQVACWPWPLEGETPVTADVATVATTTYGIASAAAVEPLMEPTLLIVQRPRQRRPHRWRRTA